MAPPAAAAPTPTVVRLRDGLFYNERLGAHNVWEVELAPEHVDEAARIFFEGRPFDELRHDGEPYAAIETEGGDAFFAHRIANWQSDAAWVSADDEATLRKFESLFQRMGLPQAFAGVVPHRRTLQLYSAFYVTRTHCDAPNWHADYAARAGTSALTLIAPLADYAETDSFQLTYLARDRDACDAEGGEAEEEEWFAGDADADGARRRRPHVPQGAGDRLRLALRPQHRARRGEGRRDARLPLLHLRHRRGGGVAADCEAIDTQSRILLRPDGALRLSRLGEGIERAVEAMAAARLKDE